MSSELHSVKNQKPVVTICVLTHGKHLRLVMRCVESIRKHCKRDWYRLIVGANAVSGGTKQYLGTLLKEGHIDELFLSNINLTKNPMMRKMFASIATDYIWWFDHDSYIKETSALDEWLMHATSAPEQTVMWGHVFYFGSESEFNRGVDIVDYVKKAHWYLGKEPPKWDVGGKGERNFQGRGTGDGRWFFATGGCWMIRTFVIRKLNWPDSILLQHYDDVLLAEALRQHDWDVESVGSLKVAINQP
jgi:GT2 family glycosyltransferase